MRRVGKKPFRHRVWHAAYPLIVLTTVFALVVAPLVVILTHGPVVHEVSASMPADLAEEVAAHGHAHDEAGNDDKSGPFDGHTAADHEHQLQALIYQAASTPQPLPDKAWCAFSEAFRHLTPEGPRRPPRPV